ncbi:MAG: 50S ribosomal protein L9 [Dehalococcoidia bacterium]|nr:50S ribosomal protein L9 [Dehalococcoidia bacterium]
MKVLFLEDVPPVAEAGDVKEVAPGYARNYLLPRGKAVMATPSAIKSSDVLRLSKARHKARTESEFRLLAEKLEGKEVIIRTRVGASDRLYGSITKSDIADQILQDLDITIDRRKIGIDKPIKATGTFDIVVRLSHDIQSKLKVTVEKESGENERGETTPSR